MAHFSWGEPGPPSRKKCVKIEIDNTFYIVRKEVAPIFEGFLSELVLSGYSLDEVEDDWSFSDRDIKGRPGVKSNHAWGLSIDANATKNPLTNNGKLITDMPVSKIRELCKKYWLRWGGDYTGNRKDAMHFEWIGSLQEALQLVKELDMPEADLIKYLQTINSGVKKLQATVEAGAAQNKANFAELKKQVGLHDNPPDN